MSPIMAGNLCGTTTLCRHNWTYPLGSVDSVSTHGLAVGYGHLDTSSPKIRDGQGKYSETFASIASTTRCVASFAAIHDLEASKE